MARDGIEPPTRGFSGRTAAVHSAPVFNDLADGNSYQVILQLTDVRFVPAAAASNMDRDLTSHAIWTAMGV